VKAQMHRRLRAAGDRGGHRGVAVMRPEAATIEMHNLLSRANAVEAARQQAIERRDFLAAREFEQELSRLHSRYRDLERQVA